MQIHVDLSQQVCGAPGDAPCGESPCGGAGCRDDEGNRHCGGLNCNGAVAAADNALERAKHAEKELNKAMGEVEGLFTKVWRHTTTTVLQMFQTYSITSLWLDQLMMFWFLCQQISSAASLDWY